MRECVCVCIAKKTKFYMQMRVLQGCSNIAMPLKICDLQQ